MRTKAIYAAKQQQMMVSFLFSSLCTQGISRSKATPVTHDWVKPIKAAKTISNWIYGGFFWQPKNNLGNIVDVCEE